MEDEENMFMMGEGCPTHGDEHMKECTVCGAEFCTRCFSNSVICPDCAEEANEDELSEFGGRDNNEMDDLERLVGEDEEVEKILSESESIPPEDLEDEEEEEEEDL